MTLIFILQLYLTESNSAHTKFFVNTCYLIAFSKKLNHITISPKFIRPFVIGWATNLLVLDVKECFKEFCECNQQNTNRHATSKQVRIGILFLPSSLVSSRILSYWICLNGRPTKNGLA
jgi:hypothetical protein